MFKSLLFSSLFAAALLTSADLVFATDNCQELSNSQISARLKQIAKDRTPTLSGCEKSNPHFIERLVALNASYLEYADPALKNHPAFIKRLLNVYFGAGIKAPEVLKYISEELKDNRLFFLSLAKSYNDVLLYASDNLLEDKYFMADMVKLNPKNFTYASPALQDNEDLVLLAVKGEGEMLAYASDRLRANKKIARAAVTSNILALNFVSKRLKSDPEIRSLAHKFNYEFLDSFGDYLQKNYAGLLVGESGGRGYKIVNFGKFFGKRQIIDHAYEISWQKDSKTILPADKVGGWELEFKTYPFLRGALGKLFAENLLDPNTIDSLNATYLWRASSAPQILVFNLYLLRPLQGEEYKEGNFANVTSFTAIAKRANNSWRISVVDALFDLNIKLDPAFKNGHKRYYVWDLYKKPGGDQVFILFKVEDRNSEYFELFAEQANGRFISVYKGGGYTVDNYSDSDNRLDSNN